MPKVKRKSPAKGKGTSVKTPQPNDSEPVFSGQPEIPSPDVFQKARDSNPAWYKIIEQAYEQFAADPQHAGVYAQPKGRGATIQQTWLVFTLFGIETYCLLARPLPPAATQRITRLVNCSAAELIGTLKSIQAATNTLGVTVAHHDGKTGHCITLKAYDTARDRFIYHDPWPARSLLAAENNAAGVDAQSEGKLWSVTAPELERVVFAAFAFPHQWARAQKQDIDLLYDAWTKSEFFKFFHLRRLDERMEGEYAVRVFAPVAFTDTVAILVGCLDTGRIKHASLQLHTSWLIDNFPLALDLAKSFVTCFAPPPDRATYAEISEVLWSLRDPRNLMKIKDANPDESDAIRCVHALLGALESADVSTDLATLTVGKDPGPPPARFLEFDLL